MLTAEHNSSTLEDPCAPPPSRVTMQESRDSVGLQAAQPHLEDGSAYRQNRPTTVYCGNDRAAQSDLCGDRSTYGTVLRRGQRVDDGRPAGPDLDLLDEGPDEGPRLGEIAAPGPHPRTVEELGPLRGGLPVAIVAEHSS